MIIALVGDSTVTTTGGWGQAFADRFNPPIKVLNFAVGGRSSKSYYAENRFPAVLDSRPDFILIQFGHNDQPDKGPERETDPETSFRDYLRIYVNGARAVGARPILVSSLTRRQFDERGRITSSLIPWAKGTRAVAEEMGVPFLDLHTLSENFHNHLGQEVCRAFNPAPDDVSHLNKEGAEAIADLVVGELTSLVGELADHLKTTR